MDLHCVHIHVQSSPFNVFSFILTVTDIAVSLKASKPPMELCRKQKCQITQITTNILLMAKLIFDDFSVYLQCRKL